jgi:hypothetical protein
VQFVPQMLDYRGMIGRVYLPYYEQLSALERSALDEMMPFAWLALDSATLPGLTNGQVGAQQSATSSFTTDDNCWLTHLVGSSSQAAGFTFQLYDTERQRLLTPQPINFPNGMGSAKQPFWLKKIYKLPAAAQMQCQVINLAVNPSAIQVVLWGLRGVK